MGTWTQRRGAIGPLDAGRALEAARTRDGGAGRVLNVVHDAAGRANPPDVQ
jgi:hypothetical protein